MCRSRTPPAIRGRKLRARRESSVAVGTSVIASPGGRGRWRTRCPGGGPLPISPPRDRPSAWPAAARGGSSGSSSADAPFPYGRPLASGAPRVRFRPDPQVPSIGLGRRSFAEIICRPRPGPGPERRRIGRRPVGARLGRKAPEKSHGCRRAPSGLCSCRPDGARRRSPIRCRRTDAPTLLPRGPCSRTSLTRRNAVVDGRWWPLSAVLRRPRDGPAAMYKGPGLTAALQVRSPDYATCPSSRLTDCSWSSCGCLGLLPSGGVDVSR
jgi:hypothetical protein